LVKSLIVDDQKTILDYKNVLPKAAKAANVSYYDKQFDAKTNNA